MMQSAKDTGEKKYLTIQVPLCFGKDGHPCSTIDQFSISENCNDCNVKCTHPTSSDYFQASVSTVLGICDDLDIEQDERSILQVATLLNFICVICKKSNETFRVYAFIAAKFAQRQYSFERFMDASGKVSLLKTKPIHPFLLDKL